MSNKPTANELADALIELRDDWQDCGFPASDHETLTQSATFIRTQAERIAKLETAVSLLMPHSCDGLHHKKKHRHSLGEPCPVIKDARKLWGQSQ